MMERLYKMIGRDGEVGGGNYRFWAKSPSAAIRKFGVDYPDWEVTYSRKGYGYYTGRIELREPCTVAAATNRPLPADFVILVVPYADAVEWNTHCHKCGGSLVTAEYLEDGNGFASALMCEECGEYAERK